MSRRILVPSLVVAAFSLGFALDARADSASLKLGDIRGESTAAGHEGEIDVLSWSWGASNSSSQTTSVGATAGKVSITGLSLTKALDASTPKLFELAARGTHTPRAVLTLRRDRDRTEYLRITLTDVLVESLQLSGAGGERPNENVTLTFGKVLIEYRAQSATGAATDWISASWDLRALTP